MKTSLVYCKSWSRFNKKPIESLSPEKAHQQHNEGKYYTVLVGSESKPSCFIEITRANKMVGVCFLDSLQREYLTYQFNLLNEYRLFLSMVTYREFEGDTDEIVSGTLYLFKENGETVIRKEYIKMNKIDESETVSDVLKNYDIFPEFGKYDNLIKKER